jgi:two-component system response regulator
VRLLLIEDNPDDVAIVERLARSSPLPVDLVCAADGREALPLLSDGAGPIDLVLLDLDLPGMAGIDVLRRMKDDSRLRDTPVIVVSGSQHDEDILKGLALGAHSHIVKPIGNCDFAWMVTSVMKAQPRLLQLRGMEGGP